LTHANNSAIFRAIDAVLCRDVVAESEDMKQVYIEQMTTVGVLMFKRQFTTALNVTEHPKKLSSEFMLAKPGIMRAFQV
jgi:hypothetical protein